jgi:protein involved in polysaccharide export with SLBB domain
MLGIRTLCDRRRGLLEMNTLRWLLSLLLLLVCALDAGAAELASPRDGYRIGANDVIRIQVFGEDDLTLETKVSGEGKINYPLLGLVEVEGRTTEALQPELTGRLANGYVRQPKVSVSIVRHRNFFVSGEVKLPGGYPYEEGLSVQKAIAMAGGLTEKAEKGVLKVTRVINGREESLPARLETPVVPDDVIRVAEAQKLYVTGEVRTPGRYSYEPGMTVQRALTLAGGFTEKSDKTGIKVRRPTGNGMDTVLLEVDALVMPDDMIVVAQLKKFYVNGEVKRPGDYVYEKGLTVHKAITMAGGFTDKAVTKRAKVLRSINGEERTLEIALDAPLLPEDIIVVAQRFF